MVIYERMTINAKPRRDFSKILFAKKLSKAMARVGAELAA